jgi:hypothetical protein
MKQFIKKIILFSLPLTVLLIFIFFIKTDREFAYYYIKGDCDQRGKLLYKKIYTEKNKVDYLFVGSSKTWNDIDDALLEQLINKPEQYHNKLFNTGYCRFGRNLDYLFCKEFSQRNRLKKIFLEVRADESTTSHPIFPFLANGKEVLEGSLALDRTIFPELYDHLLMNVNYVRHKLTLEENRTGESPLPPVHGYNNIEKIVSPEVLSRSSVDAKEKTKELAIAYRFSKYYIQKIKNLCDKKKIELVFLYLPSYESIRETPGFFEDYKRLGKVIIAPDSIFMNRSYWNLNAFGAAAYTRFLATQL